LLGLDLFGSRIRGGTDGSTESEAQFAFVVVAEIANAGPHAGCRFLDFVGRGLFVGV
jgi:hypothetical protein